MRTFDTGATRDSDDGKYDYEGFLSPLVLERYAQYMHQHRKQADGKLRDSDNWQKGIPIKQYMKSKFRHFVDTWKWVRGTLPTPVANLEDCLCAELFNTMGMLHEVLKEKAAAIIEKYPDAKEPFTETGRERPDTADCGECAYFAENKPNCKKARYTGGHSGPVVCDDFTPKGGA